MSPRSRETARHLLALSPIGKACGLSSGLLTAALVMGSIIATTGQWSWPVYLFVLLCLATIVLAVVAAVFWATSRLAAVVIATHRVDHQGGRRHYLEGYADGLAGRSPSPGQGVVDNVIPLPVEGWSPR